jgi:hypothetical protein
LVRRRGACVIGSATRRRRWVRVTR